MANSIIAALPASDAARLMRELEPVPLEKGIVLIEPGQLVEEVQFPVSGLGSIIAVTPEGECAEIGLFGRDGLCGSPVVLGTGSTPHRVLMQVGGHGYRIAAARLRALMAESEALQATLLRYVQALSVQTAHTALSNALHSVEQRLARWLLMGHDRMEGDEVPLTHDFLALMLAVRRPSVTTALHVLEGMSLIRATRGLVTIRDRAGLERLAHEAYGTPEAEYERLVGPLRKPRRP
jgi:CRP-like cAMP-binding protein